MPVTNRIADFADEMAGWRQWLHRNPELGFDLPKTSAFVAARLREIGVDALHEGIAQTGMVALIHGQAPGRVIGLRADMDALPIVEATGAAHASETPGKMHACGHDGHTTALLGAAKYLAETRNFAGTVALIFQPAEEDGSGGEVMVQEGIMDRFAIEEVYAIHTSPSHPEGTFHIRSGPLLAAVADWEIAIKGVGGHAAHPEKCRDPVAAALQIGQALISIVPRNVAADEAVVISVTGIQSGETHNVIPASARLFGTVRAYSDEVQSLVKTRMTDIANGVGIAMGVTATLTHEITAPATVNSAAETQHAVAAARDVVGADRVDTQTDPLMGAEDFSFMLRARPGAFIFMGQGVGPYCHHPEFDFNDDVAPIGASYFARLVEQRLPLAQ